MVGTPARTTRSALTIAIALVVGCAVLVLVAPAEAAARPAPRSLRSVAADQTSITVKWHRVRKAPGYRVRWSARRSMAGSHRLATRQHRARIPGLTPNTRYFVQVAVAARGGHGRRLSPWSRLLVRRTPAPPCPTQGDLGDPTPATVTTAPTDLSVATYNIRTMNLDSASQPDQLWRNRADRAAALLLGAPTSRNPAGAPLPDVIALQEANQSYAKFATPCTNQMTDLRNRLDAASGHHYEATSLNPSASVGTRILFDTGRLRLERSGSTLLAPAGTTHPHLAWAVFQSRQNGQRFFFGSVHLVPNESADSNSVRDAEWNRLLTLLSDPTLTENLPVVLGGDFNSPRAGGPQGGNPTARTHLPLMWDAGVGDMLLGAHQDPTSPQWSLAAARPVDPPWSGNCASHNGFQATQYCLPDPDQPGPQIDYLFASNSLVVKRWELVLDVDGDNNWLGTIPSDHNLLRATVTIPGATG